MQNLQGSHGRVRQFKGSNSCKTLQDESVKYSPYSETNKSLQPGT